MSDRDLQWAIQRGHLIVSAPGDVPGPKIDPTSIDLRLDHIREAKIWDIKAFEAHIGIGGDHDPVLNIGSLTYHYGEMAAKFLIPPPEHVPGEHVQRVTRRAGEIVVRPGGFLLWQTKETIGTPAQDPRYICFVDGKSTRARAGLLVHLTAPTIHAGWDGNITLEIANLGPFTLGLRENDVVAQITVAMISSPPAKTHLEAGSSTVGQSRVEGRDRSENRSTAPADASPRSPRSAHARRPKSRKRPP